MPLVQPVDLVPAAEVGPVHFIAIGGAGSFFLRTISSTVSSPSRETSTPLRTRGSSRS